MPPPFEMYPAPPRPDLQSPEYQAELRRDVGKVAKITAEVTALSRMVPGVPGKLLSAAAIFIEKTPGEGKVGNAGGVGTNFLPAPFGFAEPKVYGLRNNFYLPDGVTKYVPQAVGLAGLGFPEQRYADETAAAREALARQRSLAKVMTGESDETLQQVVTHKNPLFSRASELFAFGHQGDTRAMQIAARNEQLFRADPSLRERVSAAGFVPFDALEGAHALRPVVVTLPVFDGGVTSGGGGDYGDPTDEIAAGSLVPEKIRPVNSKAIENEKKAEGIRRELVTERADP